MAPLRQRTRRRHPRRARATRSDWVAAASTAAAAAACVLSPAPVARAHSTGIRAGLIHEPGVDPLNPFVGEAAQNADVSIPGGALCPDCTFDVEVRERAGERVRGCWRRRALAEGC